MRPAKRAKRDWASTMVASLQVANLATRWSTTVGACDDIGARPCFSARGAAGGVLVLTRSGLPRHSALDDLQQSREDLGFGRPIVAQIVRRDSAAAIVDVAPRPVDPVARGGAPVPVALGSCPVARGAGHAISRGGAVVRRR